MWETDNIKLTPVSFFFISVCLIYLCRFSKPKPKVQLHYNYSPYLSTSSLEVSVPITTGCLCFTDHRLNTISNSSSTSKPFIQTEVPPWKPHQSGSVRYYWLPEMLWATSLSRTTSSWKCRTVHYHIYSYSDYPRKCLPHAQAHRTRFSKSV